MALIPIFKILNIVTQKSVDKEKMNIIMICVRTQMFTNNDSLLWNSPSLPQFKIRSADQGGISLPAYYFFCLFNNRVKLFYLLTEYFIYLLLTRPN